MDDPITRLAQLVVNAINSGDLGVEAKRGYLPDVKRKDLTGTVQVLVIPKGENGTPINRNNEESIDWEIYVGVIKKLRKGSDDSFSDEELDGLRDLVRAIKNRLRDTSFQADGFSRVSTLNDPLYDPDHLEKNRQFTSILTITYRGIVTP